jgi:F-type H+-transporting ATPase subunit b
MQPSEIISVNLWQILVSLLNLVILFLIIKKFLYQPVKNVLKSRQDKIDEQNNKASEYLSDAERTKAELEAKLNDAENQADNILNEATVNAQRRKEKILDEARDEAESIIRQAKTNAELEMKKAESDIKTQIVDVSFELSKKIIEREIKEEDHHKLIDSFITQIGDGDEE